MFLFESHLFQKALKEDFSLYFVHQSLSSRFSFLYDFREYLLITFYVLCSVRRTGSVLGVEKTKTMRSNHSVQVLSLGRGGSRDVETETAYY